MCSTGAFGGELRCPAYARDLPRGELIKALAAQFGGRGSNRQSVALPELIHDELAWTPDDVSVFFQSSGFLMPKDRRLTVASALDSGETGAAAVLARAEGEAEDAEAAAAKVARREKASADNAAMLANINAAAAKDLGAYRTRTVSAESADLR